MQNEQVLTFGQWIKYRRKYLDVTQIQLAHQVGCSSAAIKKIEAGERRPSRQIAYLLAEHLHVLPDQYDVFVRVARGELPLGRLPGSGDNQPVLNSRRVSGSNGSGEIHNVPHFPETLLVGRENELGEIARLMARPDCRLLTLTGQGGIGKTRLAQAAAYQLQTNFKDGAVFVPLVGVDSGDVIIPAIADALGFTFAGPVDLIQQISGYLQQKQLLIVLDNLEQLIPGVGPVGELLQNTSGIKLLTTSREPLHLHLEWVLEVQGLPVPVQAHSPGVENNSAVQLFLERAGQARVGFRWDKQDLEYILQICRLVQGLPLGIELAAAWSRSLDCREIAHEIGKGLDFLAYNQIDVPERHRSMRAVIKHSWDLLSPDEQDVLQKLAVFRGGFNREAAEWIASASLHLLSTLVDKSLVRHSGIGRYDLHELVRQYSLDCLSENAQAYSSAYLRHSQYFLGLLQKQETSLKSQSQIEVFTALKTEMDNIRQAWDTAVEHLQVDWICSSASPLEYYFELYQDFHEGEAIFRHAAERLEAGYSNRLDPLSTGEKQGLEAALGSLRNYQAFFNMRSGSLDPAKQLFESNISRLRLIEEPYALVFGLVHDGVVEWAKGDFDLAARLLSEGLAESRNLENPWLGAMAEGFLGGVLHDRGEFISGMERLDRSVRLCRVIGDPYLFLLISMYHTRTALVLNGTHQAQELLEECLPMARASGNRWLLGLVLERKAVVEQSLGNLDQAGRLLNESLALHREVGDLWSLAWALNSMSRLLIRQGDLAGAEKYAQESFQTMTEVGQHPTAMTALSILAEIRYLQGKGQTVLELAERILRHPSALQETRDRAAELKSLVEKDQTVEGRRALSSSKVPK